MSATRSLKLDMSEAKAMPGGFRKEKELIEIGWELNPRPYIKHSPPPPKKKKVTAFICSVFQKSRT